ncbi:hypothetical protein C1I97_09335 [Streptomyces sp. NTH33]|uniref:hypothetical protein n=1 Tax=Streptomyces sp. NTH33 TaxID=1735453 RepID=UPI000DAAA6EB|nr:hypothetical protein [Streptomyces sp. NTH33]PZH14932.1 hypothetical protein C1I97_09335 [Streptomyces sp. NTH33]
MRVLPARRIASGALCAALLVGIAGPVAMAADPARERGHAASPDAPLPSAGALRAQARELRTAGSDLTPVADLLNAALEEDGGRLSAARARKLGDAAKRALAKSPKTSRTSKRPETSRTSKAPAASAAPKASHATAERRAADVTDDTLDAMEKDIDSLVESIVSDDVDQVLAYVDDLLAHVHDFVTAAPTDNTLPEPSSTPTATPEAGAPATTLPAIALPPEE